MVEGIKDNIVPYISNIDYAQEMYEALSKLFTIKNIGQVASLKNELRTTKMTKDDNVASFFVRIARIRDDLQAIDEIVPEKELVINCIIGIATYLECFSFKSQQLERNSFIRRIMECLQPRRDENLISNQQ